MRGIALDDIIEEKREDPFIGYHFGDVPAAALMLWPVFFYLKKPRKADLIEDGA